MNLARGASRERPMPARHVEAQLGRDLAGPLLKRVLLTVVVAGVLLSLASAAVDFRRTLFLAIGNAAIAGAMLPVARRGYAQTASVVVILALVVTTVYAMSTGNGLLDDSLLIIPGIFLMACLLLSTNWLVAVIVIAMVAVVATGLAEMHGYLATNIGVRDPISRHCRDRHFIGGTRRLRSLLGHHATPNRHRSAPRPPERA